MVWMSRLATTSLATTARSAKSPAWALARPLTWLLVALAGSGAACSSDDDEASGGSCEGGGGPVASSDPIDHCKDSTGMDIVQSIGQCVTVAGDAAADDAEADEHEAGEEHEEEYHTFFGSQAPDDECKYNVSFTNTCIKLNEPVTFTVKLNRRSDGMPASGAQPANPEVFMEVDSHPSPSNNITAPEGPDGTYEIGPIVFDRSGRWVVRFHFFETCSDIPEDSPHGHVGFYIDVP